MTAHGSFPEVDSSLARGLERLMERCQSGPNDSKLDETAMRARARLGELSAEATERRFEFEGEIARGGMGVIYRVRDTDLKRSLAMKVARAPDDQANAGACSDPVLLARFLEEARVTGQLDHPGIVPLHEVGIDAEGRVYFTMRLVRGRHLGDVFTLARRNDERWSRERVIEALIKVCEAMAYAHSKGVVHRDLKPQNIMAGRFGEVYVMDWGVAKVLEQLESPVATPRPTSNPSLSVVRTGPQGSGLGTIAGSVFGTPAYIAPEQARGAIEAVDARSDVYSVGAVLYHFLAGHPPYLPDDANVPAHTVLRWVIDGPPKSLTAIDPSLPRDLIAVCEKAMARESDARHANMTELADDLRAWLVGREVSARRLTTAARVARWCGRNPWIAATLVAVTLGGAIGLWRVSALGSELLRSAAVDDAASKARMLETVNKLYSSNVVAHVDRAHVEVTHDWQSKAGAIPLPATFLTELADQIGADGGGVTVKHYSDLPFKFRGPAKLDEFGARALTSLRADPTKPVISFEDVDGRPMLRYAAARIMGESCVKCHNSHPDSPKTDWKVGDVRGVLEIDRPLDADVARSRSGLRTTLTAVAVLVVGLTALCAIALVRSARGERRG